MTEKNVDKGKGRVKEAAGALTADRRARNKKPAMRPERQLGENEDIKRSFHCRGARPLKQGDLTGPFAVLQNPYVLCTTS